MPGWSGWSGCISTAPGVVTVGMVTTCPALVSPARLSAMTVTRKVLLRGGPVPPSALAWKMKEHGVEVEPWEEAPEEDRGLMTDIVIGLIVNGTYDAIKAALRDFLAAFPDAEAHIEDDGDDSEDGSAET
jgi:hypothetical protein